MVPILSHNREKNERLIGLLVDMWNSIRENIIPRHFRILIIRDIVGDVWTYDISAYETGDWGEPDVFEDEFEAYTAFEGYRLDPNVVAAYDCTDPDTNIPYESRKLG